jgi:hypothetical protein
MAPYRCNFRQTSTLSLALLAGKVKVNSSQVVPLTVLDTVISKACYTHNQYLSIWGSVDRKAPTPAEMMGAQNELPFFIFFNILPKGKLPYLEESSHGPKGIHHQVFG